MQTLFNKNPGHPSEYLGIPPDNWNIHWWVMIGIGGACRIAGNANYAAKSKQLCHKVLYLNPITLIFDNT